MYILTTTLRQSIVSKYKIPTKTPYTVTTKGHARLGISYLLTVQRRIHGRSVSPVAGRRRG